MWQKDSWRKGYKKKIDRERGREREREREREKERVIERKREWERERERKKGGETDKLNELYQKLIVQRESLQQKFCRLLITFYVI